MANSRRRVVAVLMRKVSRCWGGENDGACVVGIWLGCVFGTEGKKNFVVS